MFLSQIVELIAKGAEESTYLIMRYMLGYYGQTDLQQLANMPVNIISYLYPSANPNLRRLSGPLFYIDYHGFSTEPFDHIINQVLNQCPLETSNDLTIFSELWTSRLFRNGQSFLTFNTWYPINIFNQTISNCVETVLANNGYQEESLLVNNRNLGSNIAVGMLISFNCIVLLQTCYQIYQNFNRVDPNRQFRQQLHANTPPIRDRDIDSVFHEVPDYVQPVMASHRYEIGTIIESLRKIATQLTNLESYDRTIILLNCEDIIDNMKTITERYGLSNGYSTQLDELAHDYVCPISFNVSPQYFQTSLHNSYDAYSIFNWLKQASRDPLTNQQVEPVLYENPDRDRALSTALQNILNNISNELENQQQAYTPTLPKHHGAH